MTVRKFLKVVGIIAQREKAACHCAVVSLATTIARTVGM
jgi:hypothetical protein